MARQLDSTLATDIATGRWSPVLLAWFNFRSNTIGAWSGPGSLTWNGLTFLGVGALGKFSMSGGDGDVGAAGATVALSGVDALSLGEAMTDIQIEAASTVWLGSYVNGALHGTPYPLFVGGMGKPDIVPGIPTREDPDAINKFTIALRLETRMKQLARATCRRYTAADQRLYYPDDRGFNWVEIQNDIALVWG
jgi:hypothetical protein